MGGGAKGLCLLVLGVADDLVASADVLQTVDHPVVEIVLLVSAGDGYELLGEDVDASVDNKGVVHATTTAPMEKIELVSYSGQTLKTIPMNGEVKADVDTGEFPDEKHIVVVFYGSGGSSASVEVTR